MTELKMMLEMLIRTKTEHTMVVNSAHLGHFEGAVDTLAVDDTDDTTSRHSSLWFFDKDGKFLGVEHYD